MILCLQIGNTHVTGGIFDGEVPVLDFRRTVHPWISADEFGLFLHGVLQSNGIAPSSIRQASMCSVVPEATHAMISACRRYFSIAPFIIRTGVRTGLKIRYRIPLEVGADRIAAAIAAVHHYPDRNLNA